MYRYDFFDRYRLYRKRNFNFFHGQIAAHVTHEELKLATHRIQELKIKKGLFSFTLGGYYSVRKNLLKYYMKSAFGHEFLHMATSYYDKEKEIDVCGFHFTGKKFSVGRGINEGFTELLASRIYNKKNKVTAYENLVPIVKMMELFFDDETEMRKLYFSCDLTGVIHKLEEYGMDETEIYYMLFEMDSMAESISFSKTRLIQERLYRVFMSKCKDEDRIAKMENLVKKDKILAYKIKNVKQGKKLVQDVPIQQILERKARKYYVRASAYVAAWFFLLTMGSDVEKNILHPAIENFLDATGSESISTTQVKSLIENNLSATNAFLLDEQSYLSMNDEPIPSYDGKRIYKILLDKNIQYCEMLDEYYTPNGGDILFNTYCGTKTYPIGQAEPIYQEGKIVAYSYVVPEDLPDTCHYDVIDGEVYCTITQTFVEAICPDGTSLCEVDFPEGYSTIELIESKIVPSKPYDEIIDQTLLCSVTEIPSSSDEKVQKEITYTLTHK